MASSLIVSLPRFTQPASFKRVAMVASLLGTLSLKASLPYVVARVAVSNRSLSAMGTWGGPR